MDRHDNMVASLLLAALLLLLVPFASMGVDPHHDGIMLKPALDVLSGQVLFRDSFSQYGALTAYLQAAALCLKPTLLSLRLMTVAAYAVSLFFLYSAWRLILPRSLTVLSCCLFILFIPAYEENWLGQYWVLLPWSSVYALMFQSVALYALLNVIRGGQAERWGLVLGVACACVFWCRQPVGILLTGCLIVIGLALHWTGWAPAGLSKRSTLVAILGGFVGVWVPLLGVICLSGAAPEWWQQNFAWPRRFVQLGANTNWNWWYTSELFLRPSAGVGLLLLLSATVVPGWGKRLGARFSPRFVLTYYACLGLALVWQHERVLEILSLRRGGWVTLIPLLVILQAGGSLWLGLARRTTPKSMEYYLVAASAALCLASLLQYYPVPDPLHILWSLGPAFGLVVFVVWRWLGWRVHAITLAVIAAFLPSAYAKIQSTVQALRRPMVTLIEPAVMQGMKVTPAQAKSFARINAVVQSVLQNKPNLPSALIGDDALYLCFTSNRDNPSPYFVTWRGLASNEVNLQRWRHIQRNRPLLFLQKANWERVGEFYKSAGYVPLVYLPDDALEIAVPQEIADALGVGVYGAPRNAGAAIPPI